MAVLTVQNVDLDGLEVSYAAAAGGGDVFDNDGSTVLIVKNGSGGAITVTVSAQTACNRGVLHDSVSIADAGEDRIIGPFPRSFFNNASGQCAVTYSGVTSLTVAAVSLDQ